MNIQASNRMVLTPEMAAEQLGISMPTMYELCRRSDFPAVRIGRKIIIPKTSLEKWLENQAEGNTD